jgi:hypothetical protein
MRKLFAIFTALMIFFFSVTGEDGHALASSCEEASILSHHAPVGDSTHASADAADAQSPNTPETGSHSPDSHDCHFGHCGFTFLLYPAATFPVEISLRSYPQWDRFIPNGDKSETFRPPSSRA